MTFKEPDKKGPRFRPKSQIVINLKLYTAFKKKYPKYKGLDYKTFSEVIYTDNKKIPEIIINNREGIKLREQLGIIFPASFDTPVKKNVDFKTSTELGKIIYHRNWDTDNKIVKIVYTNCAERSSFYNKQVWKFKALRDFKLKVSTAFKKDHTRFIHISRPSIISKLFR